MDNIFLLRCGGTIGSDKSNGAVELLKDKINIGEFTYSQEYSPFSILSENLDFSHLALFYDAFKAILAKKPDGVIVTCGTDNLSAFAAFTALAFYDISIPTVFVSSDYPLSDSRANGVANMNAAHVFIRQKQRGVYAAYKNVGEPVKIHYGARLMFSRGFDGYVSSVMDKICGIVEFNDGNFSQGKFIPCGKNAYNDLKKEHFDLSVSKTEPNAMYITPYVGINYNMLNRIIGDDTIVVHDSYHSGSVKTESKNSINILKGRVFLVGGQRGENIYASRLCLGNNIVVVDDIGGLQLYIKAALSENMTKKDRLEYFLSNTAGEFIVPLCPNSALRH